jgi:hypothetical protein
MRKWLVAGGLLSIIAIAMAAGWLPVRRLPSGLSPIYRQPTFDIQIYLQSQTPVGSSRAEVRAWLAKNVEAPAPTPGRVTAGPVPNPEPEHLLARLGCSSALLSPFTTCVFATYSFDRSGRLVSVYVQRETDGL